MDETENYFKVNDQIKSDWCWQHELSERYTVRRLRSSCGASDKDGAGSLGESYTVKQTERNKLRLRLSNKKNKHL